jgi:hypothetical protein
MAKAKLRVRVSPSAGWVTCDEDDSNWTHVIDRHGAVWSRGEETPVSVLRTGRYVRPKLHGEQLDLIAEE